MLESALLTAVDVLARHGYLVVFLWMFADQAGLPLPAIPLLIAAGALAAGGSLSLTGILLAACIASLLADVLWYWLGRKGGAQAIGMVCKLALEPESCVTTTRNAFGRFGPVTLVIAKYLPGVQTLAPASAGFVQAPFIGFLVLDLLGTLLFVVPFVVGGYAFQPQLLAGLDALSAVSGGIGLATAAVVCLYLGVKATQWLLFLRGHRLRRLTPQELHGRMTGGEAVRVIDLRQRLDYALQPLVIPGALRIPITEIPARRAEIPSGFDIVLVCT